MMHQLQVREQHCVTNNETSVKKRAEARNLLSIRKEDELKLIISDFLSKKQQKQVTIKIFKKKSSWCTHKDDLINALADKYTNKECHTVIRTHNMATLFNNHPYISRGHCYLCRDGCNASVGGAPRHTAVVLCVCVCVCVCVCMCLCVCVTLFCQFLG